MKINKLELKVRKHFLMILFALLVIAGAVFQGIYDWHLHQQNNSTLTGQPLISSLIEKAVDGLNAPAPVDAQTGNIYFPDVRLVLPAPSQDFEVRQVEYSNGSVDDKSLDLQVTTAGILNQAETKLLTAQANAQGAHENASDELLAIFRQVPNLQSCARGVQLFYSLQNNNGPDFKLQFTKKLDNGKTLYAYNETTCQAYGMQVLVNYLRQIQSY